MQEIILGILFLGALFYMGRTLWKQYKAESSCASGSCDGCAPTEAKKEIKLPGHLKG